MVAQGNELLDFVLAVPRKYFLPVADQIGHYDVAVVAGCEKHLSRLLDNHSIASLFVLLHGVSATALSVLWRILIVDEYLRTFADTDQPARIL